MKRFVTLLLFAVFAPLNAGAQGIPVGTWRAHFPLRAAHSIAALEAEILVASEYGLLRYDPVDKVMTAATAVDGLSDVGLTCIAASPDGQTAIVGYEDGGLDIWTDRGSRNTGEAHIA